MITNLRHADASIQLATSEAELQELVDRLDRVNRKYSLLINIDKTKVMASDGIACRILMRKQGNRLEKEIMQGTMPGAHRRGRPRTAWIDNIKTSTGLHVEESIRMTKDRDKWRKYTSMANLQIEDV